MARVPDSRPRHVHLMGIGGTGMAGLAELLHGSPGLRVSGCDLRTTGENLRHLTRLGIDVVQGHDPRHLQHVDEVVVSSAIASDNPELDAARRAGIPVRHRAERLAMAVHGRRLAAVAGAHGKTTVTGLLAHVLTECGLDPMVLVGFPLPGYPAGARPGAGAWAVLEVDESDGSFLRFFPHVAVVTTIEPDHLENYGGSFDRLVAAYRRFMQQVQPGGVLVLGVDNPLLQEVAAARAQEAGAEVPVVTYGLDADTADWRARDVVLEGRSSRFVAWRDGDGPQRAVPVRLAIPGRHNVANALAVLAAAEAIGLPAARGAAAMGSFTGARRRFEVVARGPEPGGPLIVDDYAHHPTEIMATLRAAREGYPEYRVITVFQPHRYQRTAALFEELAAAFDAADALILTDIYAPPPEQPVPGVSGERLFARIAGRPRWATAPDTLRFCPTLAEATEQAWAWTGPGRLVLVMGAGNISEVAGALGQRLRGQTMG